MARNAEGKEYITPWAVICSGNAKILTQSYLCDADRGGKLVCLSSSEYGYQMNRPDSLWTCPECGSTAQWDDDCPETNPEEELGGEDEPAF